MTITTAQQADRVEMSWIAKNVDIERAKDQHYPSPRPNSLIPFGFSMPPLGTWRVDPFGEISVLVDIPVDEFQPSEGEWEYAINYPSTQKYIEWQLAGHEPPPLEVVRTAVMNGNGGNLRSGNRRRWLAARAAGVKSLKCWYSPTHPEKCASPKWDVKYL